MVFLPYLKQSLLRVFESNCVGCRYPYLLTRKLRLLMRVLLTKTLIDFPNSSKECEPKHAKNWVDLKLPKESFTAITSLAPERRPC